jgi:hypothetical protein
MRICCMSFMLSVVNKAFMLSVVTLNVIMLNVVALLIYVLVSDEVTLGRLAQSLKGRSHIRLKQSIFVLQCN